MPNIAQRFMRGVVSHVSSAAGLTDRERAQLANAIQHAKDQEPPPTIVIIGESGVGKSTTINSLFNAGQAVSAVRATTISPSRFYVDVKTGADDLTISAHKGILRVFDMPGLGDEMRTYEAYRDTYLEVLPTADVILWVHPAEDRTVRGVQLALTELFGQFLPHLVDRLVFGLNKADNIQPNNWNRQANVPSDAQLRNLAERERDFSEKIRQALPDWQGQAQAYSAERRYGLTKLFKSMMYAVSPERRWVLEERMDLADFFELVDRRILRNAKKLADRTRGDAIESEARPRQDVLGHLAGLSDEDYASLVSDRRRFEEFLRERDGGLR